MTTPPDDISRLSKRLREWAIRTTKYGYDNPLLDEAATQLAALLKEREELEARVKELENGSIRQEYNRLDWIKRAEEFQARTTRLQQERDEAYERLKPFAKAGELFQPRSSGDFDQCVYAPAAGPEYNLTGDHLRAARDLVLRLAVCPEKEKR